MFKKIKKWWRKKTVKLVWKGTDKYVEKYNYYESALWCPHCAKWLPEENEEIWTYMGLGGGVFLRRVAQCDCGAAYDSGIPDEYCQSVFYPGNSKLIRRFRVS